jgi:hypothetical protein
MRKNLARKDDLLHREHPTVKEALALPAPPKSPFLLKLFLIIALLLTLAWSAWLGWAVVRAGLSLF